MAPQMEQRLGAARAFALSLLDKHPSPGTGAEVPQVHEVLRDNRFAWGSVPRLLLCMIWILLFSYFCEKKKSSLISFLSSSQFYKNSSLSSRISPRSPLAVPAGATPLLFPCNNAHSEKVCFSLWGKSGAASASPLIPNGIMNLLKRHLIFFHFISFSLIIVHYRSCSVHCPFMIFSFSFHFPFTLFLSHFSFHTFPFTLFLSHISFHTFPLSLFLSNFSFFFLPLSLFLFHSSFFTSPLSLFTYHLSLFLFRLQLFLFHSSSSTLPLSICLFHSSSFPSSFFFSLTYFFNSSFFFFSSSCVHLPTHLPVHLPVHLLFNLSFHLPYSF